MRGGGKAVQERIQRGSGRRITAAVCAVALAIGLVSVGSAGTWVDDFERDNLRDWKIHNLDRAAESWDANRGEARGQIFVPGFYSLLLLKPANVAAEAWTNYQVRARARIVRGKKRDAEPRIGLSLYDQEFEGNRYLFLLALDTGEAQIIRVTNDVWQVVPFAFPVEEDVWYDLTARVTTQQDTEVVSFEVGDEFAITANATNPIAHGLVGLVVSDAEGAFDDVEITGDEIPNGGHGRPRDVSPRGRLATTWGGLKGAPRTR